MIDPLKNPRHYFITERLALDYKLPLILYLLACLRTTSFSVRRFSIKYSISSLKFVICNFLLSIAAVFASKLGFHYFFNQND